MNAGMKRRNLLLGGLAASALGALPTRLLAQPVGGDPLTSAFDAILRGETPAPAAPPAPPVDMAAYHKRIITAAAREKERVASKLWRTDLVGLADFALPSSEPRFHFVNLESGTVRSFYVAHGRGSDPEHDGFLKTFSNVPGSEATSRGAYLTCEWYNGKYGTSIRLVGLDPDNSLALDRAIVMHPAWYVDPDMIGRQGKLGRSEGCFAMAPSQFNEALWHLSGGRLLFADRIGYA